MGEWTIEQWVAHGREWIAVGWDPRTPLGEPALFVGAVNERGDDEPTIGRSLLGGVRMDYVRRSPDPARFVYATGEHVPSDWRVVPYLADDGTRGHALGQVKRSWSAAYIAVDECLVDPDTGADIVEVRICTDDGMDTFRGASIHEALLAARRAAP